MMLVGTHFRIDGDRLRFPGVTYGGDSCDPVLVARSGLWFVVRQPATRVWDGTGNGRCPVPAKWVLFRAGPDLREWEGDSEYLQVVQVVEEVCPGGAWRKARARLLTRLSEMAHEGGF